VQPPFLAARVCSLFPCDPDLGISGEMARGRRAQWAVAPLSPATHDATSQHADSRATLTPLTLHCHNLLLFLPLLRRRCTRRRADNEMGYSNRVVDLIQVSAAAVRVSLRVCATVVHRPIALGGAPTQCAASKQVAAPV
jgi:hypothetical protein